MRNVAVYMLAAMGSEETPTVGKLKKILGSVGVEADEEQLETVIRKFAGKDIQALIAQGSGLLSSMPSGGGIAAGGGGGGGAAAAAEDAPAAEEKKEEEPEEESDDDMGFGLFD
ncbi:uncharacterized protein LOC143039887 [Oratosquilla oratoria]|uniref:uncharacterized protein LOC143039887 n=1 Tax=Oratosquilla oratoria TaxID=337810 RepID=UPI003F76E8ED